MARIKKIMKLDEDVKVIVSSSRHSYLFSVLSVTVLCFYPRRLCSRRRGMGRSVASVCLYVCQHCKRKTASAISTKVRRHTVHSSASAKGHRSNPNPNPRVTVLTFAIGMGWDSQICEHQRPLY